MEQSPQGEESVRPLAHKLVPVQPQRPAVKAWPKGRAKSAREGRERSVDFNKRRRRRGAGDGEGLGLNRLVTKDVGLFDREEEG